MPSMVKKRSVVVAGHRTSVSLERAFWDALRELAVSKGKTINQLVSEIDSSRSGNLSSAIRVFVLNMSRAGELAPVALAPGEPVTATPGATAPGAGGGPATPPPHDPA